MTQTLPRTKQYRLTALSADTVDDALGFEADMIRIDNYTNQYLHEKSSSQYIAPKTYRAVLYYRTQLARIEFAAPAGTVQPAALAGEQALVTYQSSPKAASASARPAASLGIPILSGIASALAGPAGPAGPTGAQGPEGPPGSGGSASGHIIQDFAANLPQRDYLSIVPAGIAEDDATFGKTVLRLDLLSGGGGPVNPGEVPFGNSYRPVTGFIANAANGDHDVYTCPVAKRAVAKFASVANPTGGAISVQTRMLHQSRNRLVRVNQSVGSNGTLIGLVGTLVILEAGDTLRYVFSAAGASLWWMVHEFDDDDNFIRTSIKSDNWVNGHNVLYTCPPDVRAIMWTHSAGVGVSGSFGTLLYTQETGGTVKLFVYCVPDGQLIDTSTRVLNGVDLVTGGTRNDDVLVPIMNPADRIVLNVNSANVNQFARVMLVEIPM